MLIWYNRHRKPRKKIVRTPEEMYRKNAVQLEREKVTLEYDVMLSMLKTG